MSLAPFDSLAAEVFAVQRADLSEAGLMSGRARGEAVLAGSLDAWRLQGNARVDSAAWIETRVRIGASQFTVSGGRTSPLALAIRAVADSLSRGRLSFADLSGSVDGRPDDFGWRLQAATVSGARAVARAAGRWRTSEDSVRVLGVDSLTVDLLGRSWQLQRPARFTIDTVAAADTVAFATPDGSGLITLTGTLPGKREGNAEVHALGVSLSDFYALIQRDTTGVAGIVGLDARLGGTLERPTFRGSATITGPVVGDVKAPLVRSVFNYRDRQLQSNLSFWRTGRPVLEVDADLPLDLGLGQAGRRQLAGELVIRGRADSVDLGVIEALTPNLRGVVGNLAVDATVGGTWQTPRLGGFVAITDAAAYVPGLRVSYGPFNGRVRLAGDSVVAESVEIRSGLGSARVTGAVRLEQLTRPVLDLKASAAQFPLMDVPDYLTLRATGDVSLTGPLERPVLAGEVRATQSVLYFADLLTKDIINLEDPINADLVDTTALRAQNLRSQFQSRFLDSLTIRDLQFRVAEDVWLRSTEANVQLEGRVVVNKERRRLGRSEFRVSGQLNTPRGTYTLTLGPVGRTFQVEQGTVQYFNTPDLNAGLDLTARYVVRTVSPTGTDDYPIIARITGTLLVPKVRLESEPGRQQLAERDLVSLLVLGTTSTSVGSVLSQPGGIGASLAGSLISSEIERQLISSPDAPFDLIEIRPGVFQGSSAFATSGNVTALALGRQLSNRLFVIVNVGGCFRVGAGGGGGGDVFNAKYLGASLEYRLDPTLKLSVAAEPVQTCLGDITGTLVRPSRYQFGADLKWDREY
ncbi:MAG: translocation/assembly module TamB domain-containing protein [Gemmatimonadales bacterium]